jgi:hypothetical protein
VAVRRTAGWGSLLECFIDQRQHTFKILINLIVPKPQYLEPVPLKMSVANCVALRMSIKIVLTSIHFHNQAMTHAHKVDNETLARRLPTEMKATLPPWSQTNPKFYILARHRLAQTSCDLVRH